MVLGEGCLEVQVTEVQVLAVLLDRCEALDGADVPEDAVCVC